MADFSAQIARARSQKYSDDQIIKFLSDDPELAPKIQKALERRYKPSQIIDFLSEPPIPGTEKLGGAPPEAPAGSPGSKMPGQRLPAGLQKQPAAQNTFAGTLANLVASPVTSLAGIPGEVSRYFNPQMGDLRKTAGSSGTLPPKQAARAALRNVSEGTEARGPSGGFLSEEPVTQAYGNALMSLIPEKAKSEVGSAPKPARAYPDEPRAGRIAGVRGAVKASPAIVKAATMPGLLGEMLGGPKVAGMVALLTAFPDLLEAYKTARDAPRNPSAPGAAPLPPDFGIASGSTIGPRPSGPGRPPGTVPSPGGLLPGTAFPGPEKPTSPPGFDVATGATTEPIPRPPAARQNLEITGEGQARLRGLDYRDLTPESRAYLDNEARMASRSGAAPSGVIPAPGGLLPGTNLPSSITPPPPGFDVIISPDAAAVAKYDRSPGIPFQPSPGGALPGTRFPGMEPIPGFDIGAGTTTGPIPATSYAAPGVIPPAGGALPGTEFPATPPGFGVGAGSTAGPLAPGAARKPGYQPSVGGALPGQFPPEPSATTRLTPGEQLDVVNKVLQEKGLGAAVPDVTTRAAQQGAPLATEPVTAPAAPESTAPPAAAGPSAEITPAAADQARKTGTIPGTETPVDLDYVRRVAEQNEDTLYKTLNSWLHEAWKDAYGTKDAHRRLSDYLKGKYGLESMSGIGPEDALHEYHTLKDIAIKKHSGNPMENPPAGTVPPAAAAPTVTEEPPAGDNAMLNPPAGTTPPKAARPVDELKSNAERQAEEPSEQTSDPADVAANAIYGDDYQNLRPNSQMSLRRWASQHGGNYPTINDVKSGEFKRR